MKLFRFFPDNLDETLFEHRNKDYGAYELRKSYHTRVIKSFLISLSLPAIFIATLLIFKYLSEKENPVLTVYTTVPVDLKNKIEIEQNKKILPPVSHSTRDIKPNSIMNVTPDSLISKEPDKKDSIQQPIDPVTFVGGNPGSSIGDTTSLPANPGNTLASLFASSEPFPLAAVDQQPQFPGGNNSLASFLQNNIHYNPKARELGISGKVHSSFIINSKGEVEAIKIIRSLGYGLDEEVIRVLAKMPEWKPGYYQGKPVSTILNIPVSFSLVQ